MASITNWMCSSRSTPSSAAPSTTSSRFTPRANALSFIFFRTERASTSCTLRDGRTSAVAVIRPVSSSTANSALAMRVHARNAGIVGVPEDGLEDVLGPAARAQDAHALGRVLLGRRVRGVGKALVVEVVHEARQPPALGDPRRTSPRRRASPPRRRACASAANRWPCTRGRARAFPLGRGASGVGG